MDVLPALPPLAAALVVPEDTATFFTELGAPLDHAFFMVIKSKGKSSNLWFDERLELLDFYGCQNLSFSFCIFSGKDHETYRLFLTNSSFFWISFRLHDHVIVRNLQSIAGQALNNKIAEIITVNIYYEELASLIRVGDVQGVP